MRDGPDMLRAFHGALRSLHERNGPTDSDSPTSTFRWRNSGSYLRYCGNRPGASRVLLGISAYYHDSAAALLIDGRVIAAAHEERFTRRKHDARLPLRAIEYCLWSANLQIGEVDLVTYYEEPIIKADRALRMAAVLSPEQFIQGGARRLDRMRVELALQSALREAIGYSGAICFVEHHAAHAAMAFHTSPFPNAACLVVDGVGEWATTTLARCDHRGIDMLAQIYYPHSLGLLYSMLTDHLGFAVNDGEYKVMGLAAYGAPRYTCALERLLVRFDDGSFALTPDHFDLLLDESRPGAELEGILGVPARAPLEPPSQAHADLAASLQGVLFGALTGLLKRLYELTRTPNLTLGGGVALNGAATYLAFRASRFESLFAPPEPGDGGAALGAALFADRAVNSDRAPELAFNPFLGPQFDDGAIEACCRKARLSAIRVDRADLAEVVAARIAEGGIVGWFQGRMEFSPRALGARSILADPTHVATRERVNEKIKMRELFRPLAPAIMEEEAGRYLSEVTAASRYMMVVLPASPEGAQVLRAVVHMDGTTRPQLVRQDLSPQLHELLRAYRRRTGIGALLNTSFNLSGEPLVCTPDDACRTFMHSELDMLVLGNHVIRRETEPCRT